MEMSPGMGKIGTNKYIMSDFVLELDNGLLLDDKLTIYAELSYDGDLEDADELPEKAELEKRSQLSLVQDFSSWILDEKLSNVVLVVREKECNAHKAILAARSSVFASMFERNVDEKISGDDLKHNRWEITDIELEVFEELLRYIYSGKIGADLNLMADKLFIAADKVCLGAV